MAENAILSYFLFGFSFLPNALMAFLANLTVYFGTMPFYLGEGVDADAIVTFSVQTAWQLYGMFCVHLLVASTGFKLSMMEITNDINVTLLNKMDEGLILINQNSR